MNIREFFFATAVFLSALIPFQARSDELADRAEIRNRVESLLNKGDFQQLEAISTRYRASRSRSSSGLWHLTQYHVGIAQAFGSAHKDEEFWLRAEQLTTKWTGRYPKSPSAHLAHARVLVNHGWSFRGGGFAHTVKAENWAPFRSYVQKARLYLEKHKAVASQDPHWYELMAAIASAQSWPEAELASLVQEGLDREPLFYQTYFAALNYYAPKWGGSAVAIERFARQALARTKDAEGFGMYARIYWYASQTQYDDSLFSESLVDWDTMKKGIDDVLRKYPDSWNLNNFARFACLSHDRGKTAELMAKINGAPLLSVWDDPAFYQQCKAWALASDA